MWRLGKVVGEGAWGGRGCCRFGEMEGGRHFCGPCYLAGYWVGAGRGVIYGRFGRLG